MVVQKPAKNLQIRLPEEVAEKLQEMARKDWRKCSNYLFHHLSCYVEAYEQEHGVIAFSEEREYGETEKKALERIAVPKPNKNVTMFVPVVLVEKLKWLAKKEGLTLQSFLYMWIVSHTTEGGAKIEALDMQE